MSDLDSSHRPSLTPPDDTAPAPRPDAGMLFRAAESWSNPVDAWTLEPTAVNPLRAGADLGKGPDSCVMVIFGVSGDLTTRKLMPALFDLAMGLPLPEGFTIVGISHRSWSEAEFRLQMREAVTKAARTPVSDERWHHFANGLFYVRGGFHDPATFATLGQRLRDIDHERRTESNRLFYLATSPTFYLPIIRGLASAGVAERQANYLEPAEGWHRIVIEKPFGHDIHSARALITEMATVFSERQIYRIDHYLGKETVQNVLAFRFANILFDPVWNRQYVDHVQITTAEALGVEGRGGFYEQAGALRDIVQSHLLQLLAVVAMEPPAFFNGNAVRDEKVKVLRSVVPPAGDEVARRVVRGQYEAGFIGGAEVTAYRQEKDVSPTSQTETFVALRLEIDNWRWNGVPFYLRTGKRLARRVTEIRIIFKRVPHLMFQSVGEFDLRPNELVLRIQPDEGIALSFAAKVPGGRTQLRTVRMDFLYGTSFGQAGPDAYERLLLDAMLGDPTLFARRDEVEAAWAIVQPILDAWANRAGSPPVPYEAGTWGPAKANAIIERDSRSWRQP